MINVTELLGPELQKYAALRRTWENARASWEESGEPQPPPRELVEASLALDQTTRLLGVIMGMGYVYGYDAYFDVGGYAERPAEAPGEVNEVETTNARITRLLETIAHPTKGTDTGRMMLALFLNLAFEKGLKLSADVKDTGAIPKVNAHIIRLMRQSIKSAANPQDAWALRALSIELKSYWTAGYRFKPVEDDTGS